MCKVLEDVRFKEIKSTIIRMSEKNNKIPSILEYNQYTQLADKSINRFLIDNEISFTKLIEIIGLKQISIRKATEVYGINALLEFYKVKIEKYVDRNGTFPDFKTIKMFHMSIDDLRFRKLFGNSYTKFLKKMGIKNIRKQYEKRYTYSSYNKYIENIINNIINSNGKADIIVKAKSGAVKISVGN